MNVFSFQILRSNEKAHDYIEHLDLEPEESLEYDNYYDYEDSDTKNEQNYKCGSRNEKGVDVMLRRFEFRVTIYLFNIIKIFY